MEIDGLKTRVDKIRELLTVFDSSLDTPENADADCDACVHYKDTCDGEAFKTGCREFRAA